MPEGKPLPLTFPVNGIDVTREHGEQPKGTCADAVNVRSQDSIDRRNRGGSRPGFSKYVAEQIPEGSVLIQHLNVIVDPTTAALPQNFETPDETWTEHPRFPGVSFPPGGAPWQPNPNVEDPESIAFVQFKTSNFSIGDTPTTHSFQFDDAPVSGNLLLVWVATGQSSADDVDGNLNVTAAVRNGAGTAYTQVGSYVSAQGEISSLPERTSFCRLSLWMRVSTGAAQDQTVDIVPSPDSVADTNISTIGFRLNALEYSGTAAVPLTDSDSDSSNVSVATITVPSITVNVGSLVVAAILNAGTPISTTPTMNDRGPGFGISEAFDKIPVDAATTVQFDFGADAAICAMAASFNRG